MRVLYFASENPNYPIKDIELALKKLGHKVDRISDTEFDMADLVEKSKEADLFLFHHGGINTQDEFSFQLSSARLQNILNEVKCKKIWWYLDKGWATADIVLERIVPWTDLTFINDDTWRRRNKFENVFCLHCGAGKPIEGRVVKEYSVADVGMIGNIYGIRKAFFDNLRQQFGRKFKIFQKVYGQDFADVCKSVKVLVAPIYPYDDFYWSDLVYKITNAGGFIVHPRLHGLKEEGWVNGKDYVSYRMWPELLETIKYFLDPAHQEEREKIIKAGQEKVRNQFTYEHRLKEMLNKIEEYEKTKLAEKTIENKTETKNG
jgi:Glycosyl transferases group 1